MWHFSAKTLHGKEIRQVVTNGERFKCQYVADLFTHKKEPVQSLLNNSNYKLPELIFHHNEVIWEKCLECTFYAYPCLSSTVYPNAYIVLGRQDMQPEQVTSASKSTYSLLHPQWRSEWGVKSPGRNPLKENPCKHRVNRPIMPLGDEVYLTEFKLDFVCQFLLRLLLREQFLCYFQIQAARLKPRWHPWFRQLLKGC